MNKKKTLIYRNGEIVSDGVQKKGYALVVQDGVIREILPETELHPADWPDCEVKDCRGHYLMPGFIDLHVHGGAGYEFIDATREAMEKALRVHQKHGTRVIYPTYSASDMETTVKALEAFEEYAGDPSVDIVIPGVHLEGPYLNIHMCGAQDPDTVRPPKKEEYEYLQERFGRFIRRITYAPENDPEGTFQHFMNRQGIVASMGHSGAEYPDICRAYEEGCRLVTHLYSCTSSIVRHQGFRVLGITETAYLLPEMYVEAIGDGKHLPPELLQYIFRLKGFERVCLITDAVRFGGTGEENEGKEFPDWKIPFRIEDGVAKMWDRSAFMGSIATTDILLRNAVAAGAPLPEAVRMLTENPAKAMGLRGYGKIEKGYRAVFTEMDRDLRVAEEED